MPACVCAVHGCFPAAMAGLRSSGDCEAPEPEVFAVCSYKMVSNACARWSPRICFDLRKCRNISLMRHEAAFKKFILYTVPRKSSRRAEPSLQLLRERWGICLFTLAKLPAGPLLAEVTTQTQIHLYVIPHARHLHRCKLYEGPGIMCIL